MANAPFTIRPIRDEDDLDELNAGNPEWLGADLTRGMVGSAGGGIFAFHVAEQEGRLVGYALGFLSLDDNPTRTGRAFVWVPPAARGRGVGTALWEFLLEAAIPRAPHRLTSRVEASDHASRRWVEARGAITQGLHLESALDLEGDLPVVSPPPGVSIRPLTEGAGEPEWHAAYDAAVRLGMDTPDAETNPEAMPPYPIFRQMVSEPWQMCVATTPDGQIVGLTSVFTINETERIVNTMLTGVNREWRGKGLATALKAEHAIQLRDAGWRTIVTQNMEGNDHILAANKRLGFQPSKAAVDAIYDFPDEGVS
jgi:GNAT superfamily N-acetyltransferase